MLARRPPVGVVLAGGRGARMGGSKLTVSLCGRPLIEYPLKALRAVLDEVVVIAKPDVELPELEGVMLWLEPEEPRHPLVGIVEALAMADGRPILSCPADLPLLSPDLVSRVAHTPPEGAPAVIASFQGRTQPLLGCYQPIAAEMLTAPARSGAAVREAVAAINPRHVEAADELELFNVNSPEDLIVARSLLDQPNVKS